MEVILTMSTVQTDTIMPSDWHTVHLGDLLEEVNLKAEQIPRPPELEVLSLSKNFGLLPQRERFDKRIARENVNNYKVVKKNWLVYNPYVIWEGAIRVLTRFDIGLVSPVYVVWKPVRVNPFFLDYLVRTPDILAKFLRLSSGVVQRRRTISKTAFSGVQVKLPSLEEQRRISTVLSELESALDRQEEILRVTRNLKEVLMTKLFGEMIDNSEVKPLPLGDVLVLTQYGLSVKGKKEGGYPMLRMNNLQDGRIKLASLQYIDLDNETFRRFRLNKGDILFNRTNSIELVGKTSIFDLEDDFVFASYLIRLQVDRQKALPEFINYYLNWHETQLGIKRLANRAIGQSNISATRLKTFTTHLPSLDEQKQAVNTLSAVDAKFLTEERRQAVLKHLFITMLEKLVSGEIRVNAVYLGGHNVS